MYATIIYDLSRIVEVNSSGEFIYTQTMNRNVYHAQTPENYVKNSRRKKSQQREREILLN